MVPVNGVVGLDHVTPSVLTVMGSVTPNTMLPTAMNFPLA